MSVKPSATEFSQMLPKLSPTAATTSSRQTAPPPPEIIEAARVRAAEEGYRWGFVRGNKAGFKHGREEGTIIGRDESAQEAARLHSQALAEFRKSLTEVVQEIREAIPRFYEAGEIAMTECAMEAVKRVLVADLALGRESALAIVQDALKEVTHSKEARIRLNPLDRAFLELHRSEVVAVASSLREIDFVDDPSITAGCVIETEGGMVDATAETKLELIEEELRRTA